MNVHGRFLNPTLTILRMSSYHVFDHYESICNELSVIDSQDVIWEDEKETRKDTVLRILSFLKDILNSVKLHYDKAEAELKKDYPEIQLSSEISLPDKKPDSKLKMLLESSKNECLKL